MMLRTVAKLGSLAAGVVMVMAPMASAQGGPPPANVVVDVARMEMVNRQRSVTGSIRAPRRSSIASEVQGRVVTLDVREGDTIQRGEIIAELDKRLATLDRDRAAAALEAERGLVAQREAELDRARRDLARIRSVEARGSANASEIDAAETGVATAEALLMQAKADATGAAAALARAEQVLVDKTVRAPFTGRVIGKLVEVGEWLSEGDAVIEILSLDDLEAWIELPEHLLPYLPDPSDEAAADLPIPLSIRGYGEDSVEGRILAVVPNADPLSRIFPVRLSVPSRDGRVLPGMSLTAMVPTGDREEMITVHKDAVMRDQAGEFVFMAAPMGGGPGGESAGNGPSHEAVPLRITSLFAMGDRLAVRAGAVPPGALLLIEGNERVFPTQPLIIQNTEVFESGDGEGAAPARAAAGDEGGEG